MAIAQTLAIARTLTIARTLAIGLMLTATPGGADLYRCPGDSNSETLRFVGDPAACPGAERVSPGREIQPARAPEIPPAAASPTPAPPTGPTPSYGGELSPIFVPVDQLDGPWEIVREAPTDASRDPVLRDWGVLAVRALHYTRHDGPISQVCSVEIWAFESPDRAEAAERGFERPGWRFTRRGNLMVTLRAVTLERGRGATKGIFEACQRLGDRTDERAAAHLR